MNNEATTPQKKCRVKGEDLNTIMWLDINQKEMWRELGYSVQEVKNVSK